jgi:hypothetical protein
MLQMQHNNLELWFLIRNYHQIQVSSFPECPKWHEIVINSEKSCDCRNIATLNHAINKYINLFIQFNINMEVTTSKPIQTKFKL